MGADASKSEEEIKPQPPKPTTDTNANPYDHGQLGGKRGSTDLISPEMDECDDIRPL